jgi:hypothetical protein
MLGVVSVPSHFNDATVGLPLPAKGDNNFAYEDSHIKR